MSVGRTLDKQTIDNNLANFGIQFNVIFNQVAMFTAAVDAIPDATLTTTGIPKSQSDPTLVTYTSGELATLRSAYRDLNKFRQVYSGAYYVAAGASLNTGVPTANDGTHFGYPFSLFVGQVDGLGY